MPVVIMGHSQGGHTALSALALSDPAAYGSGGTLVGVVGYAPLWLSQRSWGAVIKLASSYPIKTSPLVNAVSVWYHYTNGELLSPGHGSARSPSRRTSQKTHRRRVSMRPWPPSVSVK